jgi:polyhydroxybutyrate depolymerase
VAHRAGVELSASVAAIGVVEGSLSDIAVGDTRTVPAPAGPISVLMLHGSADATIPLCGESTSTLVAASQDDAFKYWSGASANACSKINTAAPLCTANFTGTPTNVYLKAATGCKAGTEVRFYQLIGGNHTWCGVPLIVPPGTTTNPYNPNFTTGTGTTTNDIIWAFFATIRNHEG